MRLINRRNSRLLADRVEFADSFWGRFRGLMFKSPKDDYALIFPQTRAIHTFFVFFSIDLIYTDKNYKVVELKENLGPFSWYSPKKQSKYLIELVSGKIDECDVRLGDILSLIHPQKS
jgi:hypothetical protein